MTMRCVAAFTGVSLLALTGVAAAQVPMLGPLPNFDNAPVAPPPGTGFPPGGARPAVGAPQAAPPGAASPGAGQEPPCFKDFLPLRDETQKRGLLIKAAQDRGSPTREEMCQLIKNLSVAEAKMVKFVADNHVSCGIPVEVVTQMKTGHGNTLKARQNVCSGGPAAASKAAPPMPKLSDELGLRGIAGQSTESGGTGTFDTLTGNPLAR